MHWLLFNLLSVAGLLSFAVTIDAVIQIERSESIVIVSGGPAGVHYATLLAKKGFQKITILEASNSLGGKSMTLVVKQGVPHELGICYVHGLYTPIFDLRQEYDPNNIKIPFVSPMKSHTVVHVESSTTKMDHNSYMAYLTMKATGLTSQKIPPLQLSKALNHTLVFIDQYLVTIHMGCHLSLKIGRLLT